MSFCVGLRHTTAELFAEATVILSQETGSRTIIYNPGDQTALKCEEFYKTDLDKFSWIHFEARPNVKAILETFRCQARSKV